MQKQFQLEHKENPKLRKDDRILVLEPKEGLKIKDVAGKVDSRLFNGENKLHAIRGRTNLWSLKYDHGSVPGPLQQKFTTFPILLDFVKKYMERRNIIVTEVID